MQPASWPENNSLFCEPIVPPWGTVVLLSPAAGQFSVLSFVPFRDHSWFIRGSKRPAARTFQGRSRAGKPELQKFVSIRVHSWFKKRPPRRPCRTDLRLESPSCKNSCPFVFIRGSKTSPAKTFQGRSRAGKPELQNFVPIRVHSWFKNTPREDLSGQISGWKARATKIRVHSCSFVVQKTSPAKTLQDRSRAGKPELQRGPPADSRPRLAPRHPTPDTRHRPLPKHLPKCLQPPVQLKLR